MPTLRIPLATYRLQFNAQFRFEDAQRLAPYLNRLGVTDIYASPLLQARHGSSHGYDVTDPTRLNCEIGTERDLETLVGELRQHGMGLLLDIVPNHMAAGSENPWWMDVLENGPSSSYASFFDIDWHPPRSALQGKVLLPILGRPYAEALEDNELQLLFEHGSFFVQYFDSKFPVAPKSYSLILRHRMDELHEKLGSDSAEYREWGGILAAINGLPELASMSAELAGERRLQREAIKERLWNLYQTSAVVRQFLEENVSIFNGRRGDAASFTLLDGLLAAQHYVLSYWLSITEEINFRRFFTITDLVGLRTEDPLVFEAIHAVILRLIENGLVTGLRIDHIDGLRDPAGYLRRLQERLGYDPARNKHPAFYVIVEKILSGDEKFPEEWPVCGATGYRFLNMLNGVLVDPAGCKKLDEIYRSFTHSTISFDELVYEKKLEIMESLLAVEMRSLGHHLGLLAERDRYARDLPQSHLARALILTTACLQIYRTYTRSFTIRPSDRRYIEQALMAARERNPGLSPQCFDFLEDVLLLRERVHVTPEQREARLAFVIRWQQFTGPIMAKGFEDSALYVYNRLISLNEVGGAPASYGVSLEEFHQFCRNRQRRFRHSLNATSTHDTKRAEDVRARINVLSEMPGEWRSHLNRWSRWNRAQKKLAGGRLVPDRNEEILLYQTMIGAWPLDDREIPAFRQRLEDYMTKATREAMVHTKWTGPNLRHERAIVQFIRCITEAAPGNHFMNDFLAFERKIAQWGAVNSLSQLLIKITSPGAPDFYQGSELWDLRLVDPDNRGPVDFEKRARLLADVQEQENAADPEALIRGLLDSWRDGRLKLYLAYKALNFRRERRTLFMDGAYECVEAAGTRKRHICAFLRRSRGAWALTVVPRFLAKLGDPGDWPTGSQVWRSSTLLLPKTVPGAWRNVLTGELMNADAGSHGRELALSRVLSRFPVALLADAD